MNCASPTCRATLTFITARSIGRTAALLSALRQEGWSIEAQDDDPVPLPYCPRCKESDD